MKSFITKPLLLLSVITCIGYQGRSQDLLSVDSETKEHLILFQKNNTETKYKNFVENTVKEKEEALGQKVSHLTGNVHSGKYSIGLLEEFSKVNAGYFVDQKHLINPSEEITITLLYDYILTSNFGTETYLLEIERNKGICEYFMLMGDFNNPTVKDGSKRHTFEGFRIAPADQCETQYVFMIVEQAGKFNYFRTTTVGYFGSGYPSSITYFDEIK